MHKTQTTTTAAAGNFKKRSNNWTVVVDQLVKTTMGLLYFNTPVIRHFLGNPADGVPIHILFRKFRQVLHLK